MRTEERIQDAPCENGAQQPVLMRRMASREMLLQKAQSLRQEANRLEALVRALPQDISREADEALFKLIIDTM